MPDIGEIDWNRSLFKEILGTAIELQSAIQSGQEYMFDDEKTHRIQMRTILCL